jgi:hypothetical protein
LVQWIQEGSQAGLKRTGHLKSKSECDLNPEISVSF